MSWTVNGKNYSMTIGYDEADGKPLANVYTEINSTSIVAGDEQMNQHANPAGQVAYLSFTSTSAGTDIPGTLIFMSIQRDIRLASWSTAQDSTRISG
jgi:hypothetical protein